jgi:hypothetical protein
VIEARCKERNIKVKPGRKMLGSNKFIDNSKAKIIECKAKLAELQKTNTNSAQLAQQKLRNKISAQRDRLRKRIERDMTQ